MLEIAIQDGRFGGHQLKSNERLAIEHALLKMHIDQFFEVDLSEISETSLRKIVSLFAKKYRARYTVKKINGLKCIVYKLPLRDQIPKETQKFTEQEILVIKAAIRHKFDNNYIIRDLKKNGYKGEISDVDIESIRMQLIPKPSELASSWNQLKN